MSAHVKRVEKLLQCLAEGAVRGAVSAAGKDPATQQGLALAVAEGLSRGFGSWWGAQCLVEASATGSAAEAQPRGPPWSFFIGDVTEDTSEAENEAETPRPDAALPSAEGGAPVGKAAQWGPAPAWPPFPRQEDGAGVIWPLEVNESDFSHGLVPGTVTGGSSYDRESKVRVIVMTAKKHDVEYKAQEESGRDAVIAEASFDRSLSQAKLEEAKDVAMKARGFFQQVGDFASEHSVNDLRDALKQYESGHDGCSDFAGSGAAAGGQQRRAAAAGAEATACPQRAPGVPPACPGAARDGTPQQQAAQEQLQGDRQQPQGRQQLNVQQEWWQQERRGPQQQQAEQQEQEEQQPQGRQQARQQPREWQQQERHGPRQWQYQDSGSGSEQQPQRQQQRLSQQPQQQQPLPHDGGSELQQEQQQEELEPHSCSKERQLEEQETQESSGSRELQQREELELAPPPQQQEPQERHWPSEQRERQRQSEQPQPPGSSLAWRQQHADSGSSRNSGNEKQQRPRWADASSSTCSGTDDDQRQPQPGQQQQQQAEQGAEPEQELQEPRQQQGRQRHEESRQQSQAERSWRRPREEPQQVAVDTSATLALAQSFAEHGYDLAEYDEDVVERLKVEWLRVEIVQLEKELRRKRGRAATEQRRQLRNMKTQLELASAALGDAGKATSCEHGRT